MRRLLAFSLLVLAAPLFAQQPQGLSAQQILDKMVSVYASCSSYRDKGQAKEVWRNGRVTLRPFSTAFIRPSQFRYEFQEESELRSSDYVVWQSGATVKSWWTVKGLRSYETLDESLAAATGVSRGSSIQVPSMIFGDLHDTHRIQKLSQLTLIDEEVVSGRQAYQIKGLDLRNHEMTIWIDKEKFLLLKTFEVVQVPSGLTAEQTTTYQPEVNIAIAPEQLAFKH